MDQAGGEDSSLISEKHTQRKHNVRQKREFVQAHSALKEITNSVKKPRHGPSKNSLLREGFTTPKCKKPARVDSTPSPLSSPFSPHGSNRPLVCRSRISSGVVQQEADHEFHEGDSSKEPRDSVEVLDGTDSNGCTKASVHLPDGASDSKPDSPPRVDKGPCLKRIGNPHSEDMKARSTGSSDVGAVEYSSGCTFKKQQPDTSAGSNVKPRSCIEDQESCNVTSIDQREGPPETEEPATCKLVESDEESSDSSNFEDAYSVLRRMKRKGKTKRTKKEKKLNRAQSEPSASQQRLEDEMTRCPICFDNWHTSGAHRICVLKCGHLFGKKCAEKWIRKNKNCPQCKSKAKKGDIRLLFVTRIRAADVSLRDRLKHERKARMKVEWDLKQLNRKFRVVKAKLAQLQWMHSHSSSHSSTHDREHDFRVPQTPNQNTSQYAAATTLLENASSASPSPSLLPGSSNSISPKFEVLQSSGVPKPSTTERPNENVERMQESNAPDSDAKSTSTAVGTSKRLTMGTKAEVQPPNSGNDRGFKRIAKIPCSGSRVLGFVQNGESLLVTCDRPLNGPSNHTSQYGIERVSTIDPLHREYIPIHSKTIRGLAVSKEEPNIVLTAALDKRLVLTSLSAKAKVLEFKASSKPWSCAWEPSSRNLLYAGMDAGKIVLFDTRKPGQRLLESSCPSKKPVHTLMRVEFSNQSGLLASTFDGAFFLPSNGSMLNDANGKWVTIASKDKKASIGSASFDEASQSLMVSFRGPANANVSGGYGSQHVVYRMTKDGEKITFLPGERYFGHSNQLVMSRPCLFSYINSLTMKRSICIASADDASHRAWIWRHRPPYLNASSVQLEAHSEHILDIGFDARSRTLATLSNRMCLLYKVDK
mmetsp:Transcript_39413/g.76590  ORF Transcript_39413/g.76590 Transcript_39413/m.76590 type:complete len:876 (+) Transcript_39413:26-2653(+)